VIAIGLFGSWNATHPRDPAYPALARSLVARRENIKNTITERRLADHPDQAELVRLMAMANNS
jgi:hypothetical protein